MTRKNRACRRRPRSRASAAGRKVSRRAPRQAEFRRSRRTQHPSRSPAAIFSSAAPLSPVLHSTFSARRTAAASLEPPAIPAPTGMRFCIFMCAPMFSMPQWAKNAFAARTARLRSSHGTKRRLALGSAGLTGSERNGDIVTQGDGLHDHEHVMVSVGALAGHVERNIYFLPRLFRLHSSFSKKN